MRIIGGHDYYDSVMAHGGHDDPVVFVREKERVLSKDDAFTHLGLIADVRWPNINDEAPNKARRYWGDANDIEVVRKGKTHRFTIHYLTVILAGKRWQGLAIENYFGRSDSVICWTYDEFLAWCQQWQVTEHTRDPSDRYYRDQPEYRPLSNYFGKTEDPVLVQKLVANGISILTTSVRGDRFGRQRYEWRVNGCGLKTLEFQRVLDPYTCYQELDMWVGGILAGSGRPMVQLQDIDKVGKHGFDPKWSFRRHKEDPK